MDGNQRWTVPDIAWRRNFGDYPRAATGVNIPMVSGIKAQAEPNAVFT
ncbi:hypothetical protein GF325_03330 [Candidatus Bathyarchaeota archaeon]|nr:hypothetical protein [Candidatus Bathyarchaeota archaeon]